jgi:hypothetical protein
MAFFQPVIGGGFDQDAAQQYQWQNRNDSVDRANLNSAVQAQDAANSWLAQQQQRQDQMAREQAATQANAIAAANDNAMSLYKFNAGLAQDNVQNKLAADKLKAEVAAGQTAQASDALKQSYAQAQAEAQSGIFDPANYPTLPPTEVSFLSRINALAKAPQDAAKAQQAQSYFGAATAADQGNLMNRITADQAAIKANPPSTFVSGEPTAKSFFDNFTRTPESEYQIQPSDAAAARLAELKSRIQTQPIKGLTTTDATTGQLIPDPSLTVPPSYFASRGAPAVVTPTNVAPPIPTVTSQQQYDLLNSGDQYYDSTGRLLRKK